MDINSPSKTIKCVQTAWRNKRNIVEKEIVQALKKTMTVPQEILMAVRKKDKCSEKSRGNFLQ